jgi:hypothetical protein
MSLSKNDRTIRSLSGNQIPQPVTFQHAPGAGEIARAISNALHEEFGDSHAAIKLIVRATGANERAARNWFEGKNAPSGEFLIALCRGSNSVLEAVLVLSGRTEILSAKRLVDAKEKLREVMSLIEEMGSSSEGPRKRGG